MPVTVLPSSMTEQNNFEDVPCCMPGRTCQDDSFVNSVDNIKRQVAPFFFLVRHSVLLNLGYAAGHPFFEISCSFTNQMLAQLVSLRYWFVDTARFESGVIAPFYTRGGVHRFSPKNTVYAKTHLFFHEWQARRRLRGLRVRVFLEYVSIDLLEFAKAPDPFGDRGSTPLMSSWG